MFAYSLSKRVDNHGTRRQGHCFCYTDKFDAIECKSEPSQRKFMRSILTIIHGT